MVLALRDKRYRALAGDGDVPKALLLQTAPRPRGDFRGSGAKTAFQDASGTPKSKRPPADKSSLVSRLSVPATPSRDDVDGSGLSLPTSAPKIRRDANHWLSVLLARHQRVGQLPLKKWRAHGSRIRLLTIGRLSVRGSARNLCSVSVGLLLAN